MLTVASGPNTKNFFEGGVITIAAATAMRPEFGYERDDQRGRFRKFCD